ncbi:MAG: ABC transporter substrate-binding protein [Betaproteobacteria bacterium]|nr:ABC transporter substrate-binding protein [Betaproteobacteria bacterium]
MISRRKFVQDMALAGAAGILGIGRDAFAAEPPPETTRLRLGKLSSLCVSPQYVAEDLLRAEGFTDVQYVGDTQTSSGVPGAQAMGAGQFDLSMNFAAPLVIALDTGLPIVLLAGVHAGCFELFATEGVRSIGDLRGRTVTAPGAGSIPHVFLSSVATSVGLDPDKDIKWVMAPSEEGKKLLAEGKVNAMLAFPPDPQELRARRVGRVILNSATERPWSQYFCCLVAANREFARKHPVAAKRAVRAILKASEICAAEPERAAKAYTNQGFAPNPELARQAVKEVPFGRWREYNPEETVRFYALRLREAGMVKGAPQKLIAQGTDWRFLNELKKELKT